MFSTNRYTQRNNYNSFKIMSSKNWHEINNECNNITCYNNKSDFDMFCPFVPSYYLWLQLVCWKSVYIQTKPQYKGSLK